MITKAEMKRRVDAAYQQCYGINPFPYNFNLYGIFLELYGEAPHCYYPTSKLVTAKLPEGGQWIDGRTKGLAVVHPEARTIASVDKYATTANILEAYPEGYLLRTDNSSYFFTEAFIICLPEIYLYSLQPELDETLKSCLVMKEERPIMRYVTHSSQGFRTEFMDVKKMDIDLNTNYNDDLPHEEITKMINSDESGIIILHGVPGCGKTSYIRHLIAENKDVPFVFLDSSTFGQVGDASFISLLCDNKNSVFVVEDCEDLLVSRDTRGNFKISSLLNLSDGILGDSLKLKFLCTFNADIDSIDKALLRKGRLKVKYEFKNLVKEKAQALAVKLGKAETVESNMPLCDVYNLGTENGGENIVKSRPKIGFNR